METLRVGAVLDVVVVAGCGLGAAWRGYRRRVAYWTRGSWLTLGVVVGAGLTLIAFTLVFSAAVDKHETWVGTPHSNVRAGWILLALGAMIGGSLLSAVSLTWFARGEPTRQLSLFGPHCGERRVLSSPDRLAEPLPPAPKPVPNRPLLLTNAGICGGGRSAAAFK